MEKPTSLDVVTSTDDLMLLILLPMPPKQLTRLKLVSKRWGSLITTHHASFLRKQGPVGLITFDSTLHENLGFIPLNDRNPAKLPLSALQFPCRGSTYRYSIKDSCNGLLLCYTTLLIEGYCVYNPTTRGFAEIPRTYGYRSDGTFNLAVDPAKPSGYKIVCVTIQNKAYSLAQIEMYSSVSGEWRVSSVPFVSAARFDDGVYWNGSIQWICYFRMEVLCFSVEEELLRKVPLPPTMRGDCKAVEESIGYFGESGGHLHVVQIRGEVLDIHEMKSDYSGWFVSYRVDLTTTGNVVNDYRIVSLVRGDEGKRRSFLVYQAGGCRMLMRCYLDSNTFEEMPGTENTVKFQSSTYVFQHIETLASV